MLYRSSVPAAAAPARGSTRSAASQLRRGAQEVQARRALDSLQGQAAGDAHVVVVGRADSNARHKLEAVPSRYRQPKSCWRQGVGARGHGVALQLKPGY